MKDLFCILFIIVVVVFIFPEQELFKNKYTTGSDAIAGIGRSHQIDAWSKANRGNASEWTARICLLVVCVFSYLLWIYRKDKYKKLVLAFVFTLMLFMVTIYQWFGGMISN